MRPAVLWSCIGVSALLAAELAARLLLGLGNPVLYVADESIEYMLRPGQDVRRFGKHIVVNEYGMRSDSFPKHKSSDEELRVLVLGDSVVNGGNRTDQAQLATTLLKEQLATATARPIVIGNASAGSWGPANMLAWSRAFGFLDADVVVVVLSSHDASDVPTFAPLDPVSQPVSQPWSGLVEGFVNYLPRILLKTADEGPSAEMQSDKRQPDSAAIEAFRQLVGAAEDSGVCVTLVQHVTQAEQAGQPGPGYQALQSAATGLGIAHLDDAQALSDAKTGSFFRDNIHLSDAGQTAFAGVLAAAVNRCDQRSDVSRSSAALSTLK